jgi:hypothetical protein
MLTNRGERFGRDPKLVINLIDNVLNRITMYRLVLYYLIFLVVAAIALSFFGFLPFQPINLLVSLSVLVSVCWIANSALAKLFNVPANAESLYITAFILALIITPQPPSRYFAASSALVVWAGIWAMASKYVFAIRRKHIFNPAALAVALGAFVYTDVLEEARRRLGIETVYTLTDANGIPPDWQGGTGRVDAEMIAKTVPDYRERTFYLSGPRSLVVGFEEVLGKIGIPKSRIKTDFFPGFA